MPTYMIELYDDPSTIPADPEALRTIVAEYTAWAQKMAGEGHLVGGHKLTDDGGRVVTRDEHGGLRVIDGPYAETKEVLGGVFLVQAEDYDAALRLALDCPHMRYGPKLAVREVDG